MVKKIFLCEECNYLFESEKNAIECDGFCKTHKQCSLELAQKAIGIMQK